MTVPKLIRIPPLPWFLVGWVLFLSSLAQAQEPSGVQEIKMEKQFLNPPGLSGPRGYTHIVVVQGGKTIYISGQVAFGADGQVVGKGDLRAQTVQVFENLKAALEASGASFTDVVKMNTYVVSLKAEDLPSIREIRGLYLPKENLPASTLVGVTALVNPDLLIEVDAVAVVK